MLPSAARDEQKGDMTPMIDVVFLMIIFFVCIDFKVLEAKLDAFLPTDKGSRNTPIDLVEQLIVRVEVVEQGTEVKDREGRYRLEGHRIRWQVGPKPLFSQEECARELQRIADDPAQFIPDPWTGGKKRMACVVEGHQGTRYDDIARTADLCRHAGFEEIEFGGGMGR